ncbi:hypothetical protein [Synechococcus sp. CBW1107]|uniref:hypothetical protein n=1 Tax=Synechococcus sp. CBW1107 TaxID=2789857 RepID=UPI002AD32160|nr:hypothetical protein [Synechococcus sp. CBW1107]CAK6701132.1 hypothetical protein ICNINCKA_03007 [Synechococcus sp. CBW1107]
MADTSLMSTSPQPRRYRLVDQQGQPHPELNKHFESSEEAWDFARRWWSRTGESRDGHPGDSPIGLGGEVSTESGHWRTLRHAQG